MKRGSLQVSTSTAGWETWWTSCPSWPPCSACARVWASERASSTTASTDSTRTSRWPPATRSSSSGSLPQVRKNLTKSDTEKEQLAIHACPSFFSTCQIFFFKDKISQREWGLSKTTGPMTTLLRGFVLPTVVSQFLYSCSIDPNFSFQLQHCLSSVESSWEFVDSVKSASDSVRTSERPGVFSNIACFEQTSELVGHRTNL